ncbi:MAG: hypothetical protein NUV77_15935, partial [Thermoguttaceae bacterium]|nr:hypothetical protein [Thermoguttaceae bacterium]
ESVVDAVPPPFAVDASYAYRSVNAASPYSPGDRITFLNGKTFTYTSKDPLLPPGMTHVTGAPGVTAGRTAVRFGAGYTAQQMAQAIATAINSSGIGVTGSVVGATVELSGAATTNPVNLAGAPQLDFAGEGVGGDITGMAYLNVPGIGNRLFAVSTEGGLYYVDNETSATANGGSWGFRPVDPQG